MVSTRRSEDIVYVSSAPARQKRFPPRTRSVKTYGSTRVALKRQSTLTQNDYIQPSREDFIASSDASDEESEAQQSKKRKRTRTAEEERKRQKTLTQIDFLQPIPSSALEEQEEYEGWSTFKEDDPPAEALQQLHESAEGVPTVATLTTRGIKERGASVEARTGSVAEMSPSRVVMRPPKTPTKIHLTEIPSSQTPSASPLSTQKSLQTASQRCAMHPPRSPLKNVSLNERRILESPTSKKSIRSNTGSENEASHWRRTTNKVQFIGAEPGSLLRRMKSTIEDSQGFVELDDTQEDSWRPAPTDTCDYYSGGQSNGDDEDSRLVEEEETNNSGANVSFELGDDVQIMGQTVTVPSAPVSPMKTEPTQYPSDINRYAGELEINFSHLPSSYQHFTQGTSTAKTGFHNSNTQSTSDDASAQLHRDMAEFTQRQPISRKPYEDSHKLPTAHTQTQLRQSQVSTVDITQLSPRTQRQLLSSPVRPTQRQLFDSPSQRKDSPFARSSSVRSRRKRSPIFIPSSPTVQVPSSPSALPLAPLLSSSPLTAPPGLVHSSPIAGTPTTSRLWRNREGIVTMTQLLPESLMDSYLPPPPAAWSQDDLD